MSEQAAPAPGGGAWLQFLQSMHDLQQQAIRQYQQLWGDYVQTVQAARSDAGNDMTSAAQTYVQDVNAALAASDEQQAAVEAYQRYLDALKEVQTTFERDAAQAMSDPQAASSGETSRNLWLDPERTRGVTEAYNAYVEATSRWTNAVQERLAEANRKYMSAVSDTAQDDPAATARAAYEKYVEGVYGTYKSSVEEVKATATETAEKVQSAARKRVK